MSQARNMEQFVLSEAFLKPLSGQRLVTAVFTTFCLDPGFFEQEILPVFFDIPVTHSAALRLVQLEDAIRDTKVRPALYYDAAALVISDYGSAKLDVARHPVRLATGVFHPKMIFALVEAAEPDEEGERARKLIVACLSANLTRAGWWENVETGHVLEIAEGEKHAAKDSLSAFLVWLADQSPSSPRGQPGARTLQRLHGEAVGEVLAFLEGTEQYGRIPRQGRMPTHFLWTDLKRGGQTLAEKIEQVAEASLQRMSLEIISPYFDKGADCGLMSRLKELFDPKEVRLFLPRDAQGAAQVSAPCYESHERLWGSLPAEMTRSSHLANVAARFVHAKVYRFFSASPKREIWFVGSANFTTAAHQCGGNMECGMLVERDMDGQPKPQFLLELDEKKPRDFVGAQDPLEGLATHLTRLALRFDWRTKMAEGYWTQGPKGPPCPELTIRAAGVDLGKVSLAQGDEWLRLPQAVSAGVAEHLRSTSVFTAVEVATEVTVELLVDELNMSHKPALLAGLSAADILRYWSLLTPEQRSAFLETQLAAQMLALSPDGQMLPKLPGLMTESTLFDRLAGVFHAFHALERTVADALLNNRRKSQAVTRLFGHKHDSLRQLLEVMASGADCQQDAIDRYVIVLCARQCLDHIARQHCEFWAEYRTDGRELRARLAEAQGQLKEEILAADDSGGMAGFLEWFEPEFLRREKVQPKEESHD